jgi:hypothetical protein
MNSKSIAGILVSGILVLGGGSALAAMLPSRAHHDRDASSADSRSTLGGSSHTAVTNTAGTYTVRPGDTLADVRRWFERNGHGALWATSSSAIASETHLLFPGERLHVRHGALVVESPVQ